MLVFKLVIASLSLQLQILQPYKNPNKTHKANYKRGKNNDAKRNVVQMIMNKNKITKYPFQSFKSPHV